MIARLSSLPLHVALLLALTASLAIPVHAGTGNEPFVRGDANSDGAVDIGDAIFVLGFLFSQGQAPGCLDAADANDDGAVDIGDAIYTLGFLFSQGNPPPPPFPDAGVDPTSANDPLVCGDPCTPEEFCNGIDDDCDGVVDEDPVDGTAFYPDVDGDGFGDAASAPVLACVAPPGTVADGTDCDDTDPDRHPGADELCDFIDNDCDGDVDEDAIDATTWYVDLDQDGFGSDAAPTTLACVAPPLHVSIGGDCDDGDSSRFPGADELCNTIDDDCDGIADEDAVDATTWYADVDADGFGDAAAPTLACTAPPGHVATPGDCDDADDTVHPGAAELCDGLDNDCDGLADEVALSDLLEPARPPVAMPGRSAPALLHHTLAVDAGDPAGSVGRVSLHAVVGSRAELALDAVDLVLPGVGTDFVFARRYRSRHVGASGSMGNQWEHSYEIRSLQAPDGLHLRSGDNREDVLVLQAGSATFGRDGFPAILFFVGPDLIVDFGDGGRWVLEPDPVAGGGGGRIALSIDAHGNQLAFAYDPAGRLATITDTVGRVVTLAHDAAGRLASLDDGTGRVWTYAYYLPAEIGGSPGDLKSVTTPPIVGTPTGNDFPLGRTTVYTYSSGQAIDVLNHNLLTVTDPRGTVRLACSYDDDPTSPTADALRSQLVDGQLHTLELSCEAPSPSNGGASLRCVVNDGRGAVTETFYDSFQRCVLRRDFTGFADPTIPTTVTSNRPGPPLRATDPAFFESRFGWNSDYRLTLVVHPNGNQTQLTYEGDLDPTAPVHVRTNLREVVRAPGLHLPAGPFPILVDSYLVATGFGGFRSHEFRVQHTDARGFVRVTVRDSFGNRTQVQHPILGVVEDFEYDSLGRITAHVRVNHADASAPPERRRDEFTYHSTGPGTGLLATRVVDATGLSLVTSLDYDARGHIVLVVDPAGGDETFLVNALGETIVLASRAIDPTGPRYETLYFYDANGNRVRVDGEVRDADGVLDVTNPHRTMIVEFDSLDRPARVLREKGFGFVSLTQLDGTGLAASEFEITDLGHDIDGRVIRVDSARAVSGVEPDARVAYSYDERGLLFRRVRGDGGPGASTEQHDYDPNRNPVALHTGLEAGARVTVRVYDGLDRLLTVIDPMGNVRTLEYDENGNVTRLLLQGELVDLPGGSSNVRLSEVEYAYDPLDRRISRLAHRFDPATQLAVGGGGNNDNWDFGGTLHLRARVDDSGDTTTYEYDSAERLLRVTDALGNSVEHAYDANSNVVSDLHTELGSVPGTVVTRLRAYAYDGLDRCVATTGPSGEVRLFAHAWHGLARVTDERGNVTRVLADTLGRTIRVDGDLTLSGVGGTPVVATASHEFEYDDNGRRVAQIDPNGHTTTYEYDSLDRLTRVVRADLTDETATFDAHDQRLSEIDASGSVRTYAYDALGRRTSVALLAAPGVDPSATFATFSHDSAGRLRSATNDDVTLGRDYDSLGHLSSETMDGLTSLRVTDDIGRMSSLVYPSGRQVEYARDALGRVQLVTESGLVLAAYGYLGPDLVEERLTLDGAQTTFQYDASARPILVSGNLTVSGGTLSLRSYVWDGARNLLSSSDLSPGSTLLTTEYEYDSLGRLTLSTSSGPVTPTDIVPYQLDLRGNRLFVGGLSFAGPYGQDSSAPVPADAQMDQYTTTPFDQRLYSDAGELVTRTPLSPAEPPETFAYDALGRLRSHQVLGLPATEYVYDPLDRLVRVTDASGQLRLARCGSVECSSHDATGAEVASYLYGTGPGDRIGLRTTGLTGTPEDHTLHTDVSGSVVLVTDSLGGVVERYDYDDFGRVTVFDALGAPQPASLVGNVHLFHGHRLDKGSRLYVWGGRDLLEPATGRIHSMAGLGSPSTTRPRSARGVCRLHVAAWTPDEEYLGGNPSSRLLSLGSDFGPHDGSSSDLFSGEDCHGNGMDDMIDLLALGNAGARGGPASVEVVNPSGAGDAGSPLRLIRSSGGSYQDEATGQTTELSRGGGIGDFDRDGRPDIVLSSGNVVVHFTLMDSTSDLADLALVGSSSGGSSPSTPMPQTREHILLAQEVSVLDTDQNSGLDLLRFELSESVARVTGHLLVGDVRDGTIDRMDAMLLLYSTTPGHKYVDTLTLRGPLTSGRRFNLFDAFPTRYVSPHFGGAQPPELLMEEIKLVFQPIR